ncbi:hypothetical protein [Frankia sp. CiP1_Cm_nod2]|uniref:hypothetical protein n=1 Tax=Frankia sp. CiP1_Cm_nod2 TaxID=2897161 RepID=UPI00202555A8
MVGQEGWQVTDGRDGPGALVVREIRPVDEQVVLSAAVVAARGERPALAAPLRAPAAPAQPVA